MSTAPVGHDPATYTPPAKYNRSDGATCCPHATPVAPGSCNFCWELHRDACEPCWERHLASMTETDPPRKPLAQVTAEKGAAATTPAERRRTSWPTAEPLQQAADRCRAAGDPLLADWLDETANALSWLAPFRDHEPGFGMWEAALAVARQISAQP